MSERDSNDCRQLNSDHAGSREETGRDQTGSKATNRDIRNHTIFIQNPHFYNR